MPFPGAAGQRLLQNHFVVIVVDFATQKALHGVDDAPAANEGGANVVAELVVDGQLDRSPLAVAPAGGLFSLTMFCEGKRA